MSKKESYSIVEYKPNYSSSFEARLIGYVYGPKSLAKAIQNSILLQNPNRIIKIKNG